MASVPFNPEEVWCPRHLAPFEENWPSGYLPASLALIQLAVRTDALIAWCGGNPDIGVAADASRIAAAIRDLGPVCCLLGDETTKYWTDLALAGDAEPLRVALLELRLPARDLPHPLDETLRLETPIE